MSCQAGGLDKVADDVVKMFPNRLKAARKEKSRCPTAEKELAEAWPPNVKESCFHIDVQRELSAFLWEFCLNPRVAAAQAHRGPNPPQPRC